MAELARGERMVQIFVYLVSHYNNQYSVSEIMANLGIARKDLRSVQRDVASLSRMAGEYVERREVKGVAHYQANVSKALRQMLLDSAKAMVRLYEK